MSQFPEVPQPILNSPFDERAEVKAAAAKRWCAAVNTAGQDGQWDYRILKEPSQVTNQVVKAVAEFGLGN